MLMVEKQKLRLIILSLSSLPVRMGGMSADWMSVLIFTWSLSVWKEDLDQDNPLTFSSFNETTKTQPCSGIAGVVIYCEYSMLLHIIDGQLAIKSYSATLKRFQMLAHSITCFVWTKQQN